MDVKKELPDVINLISDIKHEKLLNSYDIAIRTEGLLRELVSEGEWKTAQELMELVKIRIKKIKESLPFEAASVNIMRHFLKMIREEYEAVVKKRSEDQSLHQLVTAESGGVLDYSENLTNLKSDLLNQLSEYKVELESSAENIINQASEHIHTNEIILTVGKSNIVEKFLKSAAKKRTFQVIVAESANVNKGHQMAVNLNDSDIETSVITDAEVFAMMSRVNKVIIGTHTILANGGLRAMSGLHGVALAAKHYSVPVFVLAHMFKLTPVYYEQSTFNVLGNPGDVLPYEMGITWDKVTVLNPLFDYVPPELVTLFISHQGGNAPSYVYRLLSELYHPEDYEI